MVSPKERWLKATEVAELLQTTTRTLRTWVKAGTVPAPRRLGYRSLRWRASDIEAFAQAKNAS